MSKFFTYEERLALQKDLKESKSLKSIAKGLDKNPTTISREIKKYSSEVARNVRINQRNTVNCAENVTSTAVILCLRYALQDSDHRMCVMAVLLSVNVP